MNSSKITQQEGAATGGSTSVWDPVHTPMYKALRFKALEHRII